MLTRGKTLILSVNAFDKAPYKYILTMDKRFLVNQCCLLVEACREHTGYLPIYTGNASVLRCSSINTWPSIRVVIVQLTVQITFIFIDFRVCDFAFVFKTQNAPCVSRFKRVLLSDRFQFAF